MRSPSARFVLRPTVAGLAALTLAGLAVPATAGPAAAGPSALAAAPTSVVTLGDSYSSGLGSGGYYNDCDNTPNAWGNLIFPATVTSRTLLACSGATIPTVEGQVATLAGLPGDGNRLVTVTVGGNDAGFADELLTCFLADCTRDRAVLESTIDGLQAPLTRLYDDIQAAAPGDRVLAGGYPLLVPDPNVRGWCYALTFLITSNERRMLRDLGVRLNDVIDRAAAAAGVPSVTTDLENRFTGHEACQNRSNDWLYGLSLSGIFAANGVQPTGPVLARGRVGTQADFVADSFHPNRSGQSAYASAFEAAHTASA